MPAAGLIIHQNRVCKVEFARDKITWLEVCARTREVPFTPIAADGDLLTRPPPPGHHPTRRRGLWGTPAKQGLQTAVYAAAARLGRGLLVASRDGLLLLVHLVGTKCYPFRLLQARCCCRDHLRPSYRHHEEGAPRLKNGRKESDYIRQRGDSARCERVGNPSSPR